jgi:choline dehydrogenase-like flavoprotein
MILCQSEPLSYESNFLDLDPDVKDPLDSGDPNHLQFRHSYGGTRMGDDPATSVVNKYGLSHEAPNLLVLGGSTFPTSSGYNPTQTIEAHAWLAAEYLAKNLASIAV